MALIVCPECGKQISDKSTTCIHCGCPISESLKNKVYYRIFLESDSIYGKKFWDFQKLLSVFKGKVSEHPPKSYPWILGTGLTKQNAKYIRDKFIQVNANIAITEDLNCTETNEYTNSRIDDMRLGIIRCPKCKSAAITTGQRGYKITTGFLGSSKTVNRCGSCGYKWEP